MWISWVTSGNCTSVVKTHAVSGESPVVVASTGAIGARYSIMDQRHGFYESDFIHHILLTGLEPSTHYSYRAGGAPVNASDESGGGNGGGDDDGNSSEAAFSPSHEFATLAVRGDPRPLTLAVVGDLGQTAFSELTMDEVAASLDEVGRGHLRLSLPMRTPWQRGFGVMPACARTWLLALVALHLPLR